MRSTWWPCSESDAVCMNQEDLFERSQQVAVMRQIYSKADNVIVWLGGGDDTTRKCIRTIKTISDRYERSSKGTIAEQGIAKLHHPLMEDGGVDDFVDEWPLFEWPWFRRTWVVQEVFNAKVATVYCGQDTLTWPTVLRVNDCIRRTKLKANSGYKALMPPLFADLFDLKESEPPPRQIDRSARSRILDTLVRGLDLDATDPRDKIFALLQLGEETWQSDLQPPELRPDYHKTTLQVFCDFTRWWIVTH
jgi:hypothetical protein